MFKNKENILRNYNKKQEPKCIPIFNLYVKKIQEILRKYENNSLILDLGSYNGRITSKFNNTVLLDICISPLTNALLNLNKKVLCADMHYLPFKKSTFDIILLSHSLQHCLKPLHVLKDINLILKKRGLVIIIVPNMASFAQIIRLLLRGEVKPAGNPPNEDLTQCHQYTISNIKNILQLAEFKLVEYYGSIVSFPFISKFKLYKAGSLLADLFPFFADSLIIIGQKK